MENFHNLVQYLADQDIMNVILRTSFLVQYLADIKILWTSF